MPMGSNRANRVRRLTRVLAAGVVVGSLTSAGAQTPAPRPGVLAIENDTVIPMDRGRAIAGQTVLVRDGRIVSVEPSARARIPSGATRVNGAGKYLIPGLADMHAHLFADWGHLPESFGAAELFVMLSGGVTTARRMIGTPQHLRLREQVRTGAVVGPRLVVGSPQLAGRAFGEPHFNGHATATPEQARAAVKDAKTRG